MYGVYIRSNGTAVFWDSNGWPEISTWFAAIWTNNVTAPANITVYAWEYWAKANPVKTDESVENWHYFWRG